MATSEHRDRRLGRPKQDDLAFAPFAAERRQTPARRGRQRKGGARQRARMGEGGAAIAARNDQRGEAAKGWQPGNFALARLLAVETLSIAREERLDHRMLGLPGLDHAAAGLGAAAGPPCRLLQELEGSLGGARIAIGEP